MENGDVIEPTGSSGLTRAGHIWWRGQRIQLFIRQGTAICLFLFGIIAMSGAENTAPREIGRYQRPERDASTGRSGAIARHALAGGDAARTLSALQRPERYPDNKGEAVEDLVGNSGRPREPADVSRWARSGSDDERPESFSYASP